MNKETKKTTTKDATKAKASGKAAVKPITFELPVTTLEGNTVSQSDNRVRQTKVVTRATNSPAQSEPPHVAKTTTHTQGMSNQTTIDKSVFIEGSASDEIKEFEYKDFSRSHTIDGSILSKDALKAKRKRPKRKNTTIDLSSVARMSPDPQYGLTSEQVERRLDEGLSNSNVKKGGRSYLSIIFSNVFTFFNMLIFTVATALIVVKAPPPQLFFLVIILANITIGIFLEIKSKRAVDKLSIMTAPTAIVMRNGEKQAIPVDDVVLDDILCLETGKQICSDAIVVRGEIEVNESLLTGESDSVKKPLSAELFSGSFVTSGACHAKVEKVGSANYVETLASHAKSYKKPKSELNNSIKLLVKIISVFIVPMTAAMLYVLSMKSSGSWASWSENIKSASGAVIGMIPAGMFLLVSTALAVSVIRLSKKRTLVRDLYCIEMLARVDVLCLDKTGTITDGTMQVNNIIEIKGGDSQYSLKSIIGSILTSTEDNNQTAMALANYFGYSKELKPTQIMPFSSQRKMSAVTFEGAGTYMIGAPEFVLRDVGVRIEKIVNESAANGYRVLVLAHSPSEIINNKLPAVRRPMCLIVIEDHIRDDAIETIRWFKENNVSVRVISGDNPITVSEVAKRVGVDRADLYISLDKLSNQEVIEAAGKYTVFGRVSPEQKMLLIKAIKAKGHTVAMTGDGVNDILAMREADCSISIASGSEAARNVSHLVLQDSSFTSMPDVVREGRRVVNNIQKSSSLFLMKTMMSILLSIVFLIIPTIEGAIFIKYPYETNNLLLFEMIIIALPSFVLALQSNHNIIRGKFLSNVIGRCVPGGVTLVFMTMAIYYYNSFVLPQNAASPDYTLYTTMLVITLTLTGIMLLAKTCEPFDMARTILLLVVTTLSLVAIFILNEGLFGIKRGIMSLQDIFFIGVVVLSSYFIVAILTKIMRAMKVLN